MESDPTSTILQQHITTQAVIKTWQSLDEIIQSNPIFRQHIIERNLKRLTKSAYGFIWTHHFPLQETFKTLYHFPDFSVSTYGNVINTKTGDVVKMELDSNGYYFVDIYQMGSNQISKIKYESWFVHVLVADTFLNNNNYFPYNVNNTIIVYHKDNNKLNNLCNNLTFDRPPYLPTKINQIDMATQKVIRTFPSLKHAVAFMSNTTEQDIINACTGVTNCTKGYAWKFFYG